MAKAKADAAPVVDEAPVVEAPVILVRNGGWGLTPSGVWVPLDEPVVDVVDEPQD